MPWQFKDLPGSTIHRQEGVGQFKDLPRSTFSFSFSFSLSLSQRKGGVGSLRTCPGPLLPEQPPHLSTTLDREPAALAGFSPGWAV